MPENADDMMSDTGPAGEHRDRARPVRLDTSRMKSSYCNVCNATSTKEEVVLNFGLNESWDRGEDDMRIAIEHRIILAPVAAKKLRDLLDTLLAEHEKRHGSLGV